MNNATKYTLLFIILINFSAIISGCSSATKFHFSVLNVDLDERHNIDTDELTKNSTNRSAHEKDSN